MTQIFHMDLCVCVCACVYKHIIYNKTFPLQYSAIVFQIAAELDEYGQDAVSKREIKSDKWGTKNLRTMSDKMINELRETRKMTQ